MQNDNRKPEDVAEAKEQGTLAAANGYAPTMHLRWSSASDKEESGPCGTNLRAWPEMGTSGWVLQQWWTDGKTGEWRNVEEDDSNEPPKAHTAALCDADQQR